MVKLTEASKTLWTRRLLRQGVQLTQIKGIYVHNKEDINKVTLATYKWRWYWRWNAKPTGMDKNSAWITPKDLAPRETRTLTEAWK